MQTAVNRPVNQNVCFMYVYNTVLAPVCPAPGVFTAQTCDLSRSLPSTTLDGIKTKWTWLWQFGFAPSFRFALRSLMWGPVPDPGGGWRTHAPLRARPTYAIQTAARVNRLWTSILVVLVATVVLPSQARELRSQSSEDYNLVISYRSFLFRMSSWDSL